jgi:DNA-binding CsgD family transcriptional regulator
MATHPGAAAIRRTTQDLADVARCGIRGIASRWNRRVGLARPIRRHRRPNGADCRGFDIGIGRVVELPSTAAAGAVVLRAGPGGVGRQDGGRAAHQVRQACRGVRASIAHRRGLAGRCGGKRQRSNDLALDAARCAEESGQRAIETLAPHDAVRFGDPSSLGRLVDIGTGVGGRLAAVIGAHAAALRDRDAAAILAAAHQFEAIGASLSAADAAAQAASAFQASDDRRRTVEAAAIPYRLAAECGGIRTPALDLAAHPLPLTMREREIGNLVAAGLNNEIADRLVVSVRTVEGHLYRACTKLDICDRELLAATIRGDQTGSVGLPALSRNMLVTAAS